MTNSKATKYSLLETIDTYEGMIRLAWARGERAEDLLARRTALVLQLQGLK